MIKFIMLLAVALLISVTELSAAPRGHINDMTSSRAMYIKYASIDWGDGLLLINGHGFPADAESLRVTLGDDELIVVEIDTDGDIVAELPDHLMSADGFQGDALLVVNRKKRPRRTASFMLTIGAVGPQGEKGDIGDTGPMGPQGEQGLQGDVGPIGPIGLTGPKGATGPIGATGLKGDKGDTGPAGSSQVYLAQIEDFFNGRAIVCKENGDKVIHYGFDACPFGYVLIPNSVNYNGVQSPYYTCINLILQEASPTGGWGVCIDY